MQKRRLAKSYKNKRCCSKKVIINTTSYQNFANQELSV